VELSGSEGEATAFRGKVNSFERGVGGEKRSERIAPRTFGTPPAGLSEDLCYTLGEAT
jgi:hypothetical protein